MMRAFKYPLHPNMRQRQALEAMLRQCCDLYNAALEQRILARKQRCSISLFDQQKQLTELRRSDPQWSSVSARVQYSALERLDLAFQGFFRRCKAGSGAPGFPRFRSVKRYASFSFPAVPGVTVLRKNRVLIPKLGHVKLNLYRPVVGEIRDVTIHHDAAGKWWVGFSCAIGAAPAKISIASSVGIDLGLTTLVALSNGEEIVNPRFTRLGEDLLAQRQRACSRKQRGSKSHGRACVLVAKTYAHVANQRLDHARKRASELFTRFDLVAHESLDIEKLAHVLLDGRLSKSINDAGWGIFLRCLASKAENAGKWLVPVDPRGTSQQCSSCGATVKKTLSEREHHCGCGLKIDRDHNAAINVLMRGLRILELGKPGDEGEVLLRDRAAKEYFKGVASEQQVAE